MEALRRWVACFTGADVEEARKELNEATRRNRAATESLTEKTRRISENGDGAQALALEELDRATTALKAVQSRHTRERPEDDG